MRNIWSVFAQPVCLFVWTRCFADFMRIASMRKWLNAVVSTLFSAIFGLPVCSLYARWKRTPGGIDVSSGLPYSSGQARASQATTNSNANGFVFIFSVLSAKFVLSTVTFILSLAAAHGLFIVMSFFLFASHIVFCLKNSDEMISFG